MMVGEMKLHVFMLRLVVIICSIGFLRAQVMNQVGMKDFSIDSLRLRKHVPAEAQGRDNWFRKGGYVAYVSGILIAQDSIDDFTRDSLNIVKPKVLRPQLRIDARTSTYEGQRVNIYGYDAGVLIDNRMRIALGYYRVDNDLPDDVELLGSKTRLDLSVNCFALNSEITFYDKRYLSFGFPLEFGFGNYRLKYHDPLSDRIVDDKRGLLGFTNFGLSATFKPIRWFGIKGIAGYRKTIYPNERVFAFNGWFSSIGLAVEMQEIIKDIRLYRLMKRHNRNFHRITTLTELITD